MRGTLQIANYLSDDQKEHRSPTGQLVKAIQTDDGKLWN